MRRCLPVLLSLLAALVALACGTRPTGQPTPGAGDHQAALAPIAYRIGHSGSTTSLSQQDGSEFAAEVARRTNGAATGRLFANAALASQQELIEQLQLGDLEIAITSSTFVGVVPQFAVLELPFAFQD